MFPTRLTDAKVLRDTAEAKAVTAWELTAGEPRYVLGWTWRCARVPALS